jgi:hypothetical protein
MIGITSYGAYIPKLRLERMAIFQSMGWFAPALMMVAQGERAMCNWDEDAVTMAVAAARDCLTGMDKQCLEGLFLASTTLPFADRQNAGIVSTALNLYRTTFLPWISRLAESRQHGPADRPGIGPGRGAQIFWWPPATVAKPARLFL